MGVLLACAIAQIVLYVRRRADSDETVWACVRRVLLCLTVSVMALTPSIVAPTNSRAVNATNVVVAVDDRFHGRQRRAIWFSRTVKPSRRGKTSREATSPRYIPIPVSPLCDSSFRHVDAVDPGFERDRQLGGYTRA